MAVHQSNSFREVQTRKENLFKAAELHTDFKKAWNAYREDPSKALSVIKTGEELMAVQKSLDGKAHGSLGPAQLQLRIDYAKDTIAKGLAKSEMKKSQGSTWEHYTDENGCRVTKIG